VNVARLESKAGNFLFGKREGEGGKREIEKLKGEIVR
jgi:hypothetical protein